MRYLLTSLLTVVCLSYGCDSGNFKVCGDSLTHKGYNYSTVLIGEQCWFSENCRYLPEVSSSSEGNETDPYYYVYGYEGTDVESAKATSNYEIYGSLYNSSARKSGGICPSGWHIPSDDEFTQLTDFLGGEWKAGDAMKSTSGWKNNGNGSNLSGFNALPGGYRDKSGSFHSINNQSYIWSPSLIDRYVNLYYKSPKIYSDVFAEAWSAYGLSARCLQD